MTDLIIEISLSVIASVLAVVAIALNRKNKALEDFTSRLFSDNKLMFKVLEENGLIENVKIGGRENEEDND